VTAYLNQLVRNCHTLFYKPERFRLAGIAGFYARTLPALLNRLVLPIAASAFVFLTSIAISFFMVKSNIELAEMFLPGDAYEMAVNDLAMRKQFSNFDQIPEDIRTALSFFLWINNSTIAVYCFAMGVTLGLGTIFILIRNGFMLGALMSVYFMNGHFLDFFSLIMVHGSIELTAIIIAGGAGINIGLSVINPGRVPRAERLKENVKSAFLALIGVVTLLLAAGLIEAFITPLKLPAAVRIIIAGVNLSLIVIYFMRGRKVITS
jgi:uncharacterized membrane protein SpoIIM required for sporulation